MNAASPIKTHCSEAEWQARLNLAACYRIFDLLGWSESIYNHITLKVPDDERAFLMYYMLQRACEVQVKTAALGHPITVAPDIISVHQRDRDQVAIAGVGEADLKAWIRKLDKIDPSWRD